MRNVGILGAIVTLSAVVVVAGAWLILRPAVSATSTADPDVTVSCEGSTSLGADACLAWGERLLSEGAPSTTFELEDVVRVELARSGFGYGPCEARWYLGRYPDEVAWSEDVRCPSG